MAMVDSSVGGKTGVNHPLGKNMIGAFYQPKCVLIDVDTLSSLPDRELASGISEIIKYGLIRDPALFEWLEANMDRLLARDAEVSCVPLSIYGKKTNLTHFLRFWTRLFQSEGGCQGTDVVSCLLFCMTRHDRTGRSCGVLCVQAMTYAIERSCINKSEVVSADEKEGGVRATLNLGHTFGHAMESSQGYGKLPYGYAGHAHCRCSSRGKYIIV